MQLFYVSVGYRHTSGIDTAMAVWPKSVPVCLRHCGRFPRRGARPEREGIPGLPGHCMPLFTDGTPRGEVGGVVRAGGEGLHARL